MPLSHAVVSKSSAHVEALKAKHKYLSDEIETEQSRPFVRENLLTGLKRKKLKLKEQIEKIS